MMKKSWDYIDCIIKSSSHKINISSDYNETLLKKLNAKKQKKHKNWLLEFINRPVAASFILSGIIMSVLGISNIQYSVLNIEGKITFQSNVYQYECRYKLDGVKSEIEEWF
ncbi:hypothetical protein [Clostridium akagii]|uniref:hypothetical protein n=1 Tax=Clostridium akagii TaxID=91623 RepID=UPI00068BE45D|nr:hypothetical protein [Clostridium akagii]